ncbi:MAG TPA: IS630 family transposase [Nitrososphaerales archaeon]|nr:IS630 family transposase [Nitrososphaerales archaeon]
MMQPTAQHRYAQSAKSILMEAEGNTNNEITEKTGLSKVSITKWKRRFVQNRLDGLKDLPRSSAKPKYNHKDILKIVNTAYSNPPEPFTNWSIRRLSESSGIKMKKSRVHEILKSLDLKPHQYRMWLFPSHDPEFERKEMEICGLYINPPENGVVICVDEKPAIQALERIHPSDAMEQARVQRMDFHYKRHGVLNLFGAFSVKDGFVYGKPSEKKKAPDFLDFLEDVYSRWSSPTRELHIIMDNYGTHTSHLVTEWISNHTRVKFHYTPTHASWLNQIELWFSILHRQVLQRGDFKSKEDLGHKLVQFVEDYNQRAKPFAWTYKGRPLMIMC